MALGSSQKFVEMYTAEDDLKVQSVACAHKDWKWFFTLWTNWPLQKQKPSVRLAQSVQYTQITISLIPQRLSAFHPPPLPDS